MNLFKLPNPPGKPAGTEQYVNLAQVNTVQLDPNFQGPKVPANIISYSVVLTTGSSVFKVDFERKNRAENFIREIERSYFWYCRALCCKDKEEDDKEEQKRLKEYRERYA